MLPFLTLLLSCQLLGEIAAQMAGLPVPGPVLGLMLLFVGLTVRNRSAPEVERHADNLLGYLSLLFVPAGVGVVQYLSLLTDEWLPVTASLVGSAVVGIGATGLTMTLLTRASSRAEAAES